jgi:predicted Fe-Mo cluster-binding NifX family protein
VAHRDTIQVVIATPRSQLVKMAIPLFGSRVSPRFDCASAFLIVIVEQGEETQRQVLAAAGWTPEQRVAELKALAVNAVICGGIDR